MSDISRLATVTADDFKPQVDQPFNVTLPGDEPVAFSLKSVTTANYVSAGRRQSFSLLFTGPKNPALPQDTYTLSNESLGVLDIFLVPVGESATDRTYEAIFN